MRHPATAQKTRRTGPANRLPSDQVCTSQVVAVTPSSHSGLRPNNATKIQGPGVRALPLLGRPTLAGIDTSTIMPRASTLTKDAVSESHKRCVRERRVPRSRTALTARHLCAVADFPGDGHLGLIIV